MKNEIVFKTNDVCSRLGISRRTFWYWTKKGKVHYTRIGQTLIFDRDEADRLGLLTPGVPGVQVTPEIDRARVALEQNAAARRAADDPGKAGGAGQADPGNDADSIRDDDLSVRVSEYMEKHFGGLK